MVDKGRTPAIMIQGTGSNVGKSLLVAGLCRAFRHRGMRVLPFKPQNMSNNAAAVDGGEIGRAQALQALAAGVEPTVHMNPVLLKPESNYRSQVIVQGRRHGQLEASRFREGRQSLLAAVMESFAVLCDDADIVVIEGAGSPAETNLRAGDIANMGFARAADVPVILAGDIDRGGVIASLAGTHTVLAEEDRKLIRGFMINKFRGDISLFDDGMKTIAGITGWQPLGILPWFDGANRLPAEDAVDLETGSNKKDAVISIAVPMVPRIANFDDLDPLKLEPSVRLVMVPPGQPLPGDADLVILPGTKSTIADMAFFRAQGWDIDLIAHYRRGGHILGICGGYQMLGKVVRDPSGVEGPEWECTGLGLLDVVTDMGPEKATRKVEARHRASGMPVPGYEIHIGRTSGPDCSRAPFTLDGTPEGAASADGRISGTYLHGLFSSDAFRKFYLDGLAAGPLSPGISYGTMVEQTLDELAEAMERHLDMEQILHIARSGV